jgi:hypothetical protein
MVWYVHGVQYGHPSPCGPLYTHPNNTRTGFFPSLEARRVRGDANDVIAPAWIRFSFSYNAPAVFDEAGLQIRRFIDKRAVVRL